MTEEKKMKVLIVEDGVTSLEIIKDAIRSLPCPTEMSVCVTGEEAVAFLDDCISKGEEAVPSLAVLDLEIPEPHGLKVLEKIKTNDLLKDMLVLVNTASSKFEYMREAQKWDNVVYMKKGFGNSEAIYKEVVRLKPEIEH